MYDIAYLRDQHKKAEIQLIETQRTMDQARAAFIKASCVNDGPMSENSRAICHSLLYMALDLHASMATFQKMIAELERRR